MFSYSLTGRIRYAPLAIAANLPHAEKYRGIAPAENDPKSPVAATPAKTKLATATAKRMLATFTD